MDAGRKKEYRRFVSPSLVLLLTLLLSLFLLSGCDGLGRQTEQDAVHVIRLATDYREEHLGYQQLQIFAKNLSDKSHGAVEVQLYQTGRWSKAESFTRYIDVGTLEMACLPIKQAAALQPMYAIYEQPYLFPSLQLVERYVTGTNAQTALQQLPPAYYGIGFVADGYCYVTEPGKAELFSYGDVKRLAEIHELSAATVYDVQTVYRLHPLIVSQQWWRTLTEQEQIWIQESFQESLTAIFIYQREIAPQRLVESDVTVQQNLPPEWMYLTERWVNQRELYFSLHSDVLTAYWRPTVTVPTIGKET